MEFKLKEKPELVYNSEVKQFTIVDETGKEYELRIDENTKSTEILIWNDPGGWDDLNDDEIYKYIYDFLPDDEWDLEKEEKQKMYEKMNIVTEKFISENGEVKDHKKIDSLIYEVLKETDYKKRYEGRFYDAYKYVMDYLNNN